MLTLKAKTSWIFRSSFLVQLCGFVATPILATIYGPSAFGYFGQYSSLVVVIGSLSTVSIPLAIVTAHTEAHARLLCNIALIVSFVICLVAAFSIRIGLELFQNGFELKSLISGAVGVGAFYFGLARVCKTLETRTGNILRQSRNNVFAAVFSNAIKIFVGWNFPSFLTLCAGNITSNFIRSWTYFIYVARSLSLSHLWSARYWRCLWYVLRKYRRFTIYNFPAEFISILFQQAIVVCITVFFGLTALGLYVLVKGLLGVPLKFAGSTFQDMFRAHLRELKDEEEVRRLVILSFFIIVGICLFGAIIIYVLLYSIVGLFFDERWAALTLVTFSLLPYYLGRLIVIPFSAYLIYSDRQDALLKFELISGVARVTYVSPLFFDLALTEYLLIYSLTNAALYGYLCVATFILIRKNSNG